VPSESTGPSPPAWDEKKFSHKNTMTKTSATAQNNKNHVLLKATEGITDKPVYEGKEVFE